MDLEKEVFDLALDDVVPNRFQPREKFDDTELNELATSIKEHGVIQPIIVRKIGDKYEIVAGERRFRASVAAGKTSIPAIIRNIDDKESAKIALLENLQRKNLTAIEEAKTYQTIINLDNITQDELANTLGVSQSTIANKLRLLNLIPEVQNALLQEKISERHARSLLNLNDPAKQKEFLDKIILQRMTVKQLDDAIDIINGKQPVHEEENDPLADFMNNFVKEPEVVEQVKEEPVVENKIEIKEPINRPINRHIFDGLRREEETKPIVEEETPIDPYHDKLEDTFVPSSKDIVRAPKEDKIPIPKYQGPKYDFPNMTIENPINNTNQLYTTVDKIESPIEQDTIETKEKMSEVNEVKEPSPTLVLESKNNDIYDMRFAINNFRQAIQNTEKFGFKIETEEFDFDNVYQIVIKIDKKK